MLDKQFRLDGTEQVTDGVLYAHQGDSGWGRIGESYLKRRNPLRILPPVLDPPGPRGPAENLGVIGVCVGVGKLPGWFPPPPPPHCGVELLSPVHG